LRERALSYLVTERFPVFWCPGCGNGVILGSIARTLARLGLERHQVVVVTGIGCWGKADDYLDTNAIHGTHGRALAIATGIKVARPELTVLALMGDGDCATIGGNHLIHAARRNVGVVAVVSNNFNYGMTGGQYSATSPPGATTSTSPYGNPERNFDLCALAEAAGANYVARASVYHVRLLDRLLMEAFSHPGFCLVEVLSTCPVYFGRYNRLGGPAEVMRWLASVCVPRERYETLVAQDREGKFPIGKLVERRRPPFSERYATLQARARQLVQQQPPPER